MKQMRETKTFFQYVIPAVLSFALSGIYAIADGLFVGNSMGDLGLSTINMAFPIVAGIQALGTGIGMGGAIYYSINRAEKKEARAGEFTAGALWMIICLGLILTVSILFLNGWLLRLLGADGQLLSLGKEYIAIIGLGAILHISGTGLIPFVRNHGGPTYAMVAMISGFVANIILDYLLIWRLGLGVTGAAFAVTIGQGVTMGIALIYLLRHRQFTLRLPLSKIRETLISIVKIGIAPFGLVMTPTITLVIINRFSVLYGGEKAIATYACLAYIMCILYLVLQGVGDGSQPLFSRHYGEKAFEKLKDVRKLAYSCALILSVIGCAIMYVTRENLGLVFGASAQVNGEVAKIIPMFLLSVPFVVVTRITTASFYATEKSTFSYFLTFSEPLFMLILMLILPPLFGGQIMIWWSTVFARILSALLAFILKKYVDRQSAELPLMVAKESRCM